MTDWHKLYYETKTWIKEDDLVRGGIYRVLSPYYRYMVYIGGGHFIGANKRNEHDHLSPVLGTERYCDATNLFHPTYPYVVKPVEMVKQVAYETKLYHYIEFACKDAAGNSHPVDKVLGSGCWVWKHTSIIAARSDDDVGVAQNYELRNELIAAESEIENGNS